MNRKWQKRRKRVWEIIEVGSDLDLPSRIYDYFNASAIIVNLLASILYTFEEFGGSYGFLLVLIEDFTVALIGIYYHNSYAGIKPLHV